MDNRDLLLNILESAEDFVSGSELADRLGVTRAAVWKYIKSLKEDGYDIEAVTNRGYRISPFNDVVTAGGIAKELGDIAEHFSFEVLPVCTSTNSVLKEKALGLPEWHAVVAGYQTAGRGRRGRSFYSPEGTGLYMSVLLRPKVTAKDATLITAAASVAVCKAIQEMAKIRAEIKWVNDVFVHGKKVCGILTEASFDMESGTVEYIILGVGINVTEPESGFPDELSGIAGAIFPRRQPNMRNRLAAAFFRHFFEIYADFPLRGFVKEYQSLSFLIGREVCVLRGDGSEPATVLEIDDECRLVVRYANGKEEALFSGEVSVRPMEVGR